MTRGNIEKSLFSKIQPKFLNMQLWIDNAIYNINCYSSSRMRCFRQRWFTLQDRTIYAVRISHVVFRTKAGFVWYNTGMIWQKYLRFHYVLDFWIHRFVFASSEHFSGANLFFFATPTFGLRFCCLVNVTRGHREDVDALRNTFPLEQIPHFNTFWKILEQESSSAIGPNLSPF